MANRCPVPSEHSTHPAAGAAVIPLPVRRALRVDPARLLPSLRSLALGFALLALPVAAYAGARASSVFAVERIEVAGLPPGDAAAVRQALGPVQGESLLSLRRPELERRLAGLPGLLGFTYDRAFPHTLAIRATPEVPVAVLRRGAESWLVSRRGRVLRRLPLGAQPALPRIWVPQREDISLGATLDDAAGGAAARALALLARIEVPGTVRTVRTRDELTYVLRSGLEIRLGTTRDAELKLAIAARIVPGLGDAVDYLDLRVPSRPVAGANPQLGD